MVTNPFLVDAHQIRCTLYDNEHANDTVWPLETGFERVRKLLLGNVASFLVSFLDDLPGCYSGKRDIPEVVRHTIRNHKPESDRT